MKLNPLNLFKSSESKKGPQVQSETPQTKGSVENVKTKGFASKLFSKITGLFSSSNKEEVEIKQGKVPEREQATESTKTPEKKPIVQQKVKGFASKLFAKITGLFSSSKQTKQGLDINELKGEIQQSQVRRKPLGKGDSSSKTEGSLKSQGSTKTREEQPAKAKGNKKIVEFFKKIDAMAGKAVGALPFLVPRGVGQLYADVANRAMDRRIMVNKYGDDAPITKAFDMVNKSKDKNLTDKQWSKILKSTGKLLSNNKKFNSDKFEELRDLSEYLEKHTEPEQKNNFDEKVKNQVGVSLEKLLKQANKSKDPNDVISLCRFAGSAKKNGYRTEDFDKEVKQLVNSILTNLLNQANKSKPKKGANNLYLFAANAKEYGYLTKEEYAPVQKVLDSFEPSEEEKFLGSVEECENMRKLFTQEKWEALQKDLREEARLHVTNLLNQVKSGDRKNVYILEKFRDQASDYLDEDLKKAIDEALSSEKRGELKEPLTQEKWEVLQRDLRAEARSHVTNLLNQVKSGDRKNVYILEKFRDKASDYLDEDQINDINEALSSEKTEG
jgi:ribosomal protein L21E